MHLQLLTQVSNWSETLQNDSWMAKDNFWKSRPKFIFFVKFDTTMPKVIRIAPINDSLSPLGSKISLFFSIRAAISEIQLILTLNGKLALIII